jgi:hypothetical protein
MGVDAMRTARFGLRGPYDAAQSEDLMLTEFSDRKFRAWLRCVTQVIRLISTDHNSGCQKTRFGTCIQSLGMIPYSLGTNLQSNSIGHL